ncbi:MAG: hypothetical protein CVT60_00570 [Actinobacteria bacterium HGW-Actinobacteria-10]|jgi:V/A-type H+-transporting ATPase subunit F|nr:MAG: hypothetical protein CVT60_00570 [Actinobacteria bacterium HGW-Actinobacteria-10]
MTLMKIAVAGDSASVAGFRVLGFEVFVTRKPEDVREVWPRLVGGEFAAVFVTEPVFLAAADLMEGVIDRTVPAITVIPGAGSPGGVGQHKIDRAIERALGTTVPNREEDI